MQRFCSKPCWYAWHRGLNNAQSNRVDVRCDHCGAMLQKTPGKVGALNYCGRPCSNAAHGAKITGANHPNWRGGAIAGRGPSWHKTRGAIVASQGDKCADCGMTNEEHRTRYRAGLHVHHRTPYRLSLDNGDTNLVAVCIPCHGKEESAIHRKLSAADVEAMRTRTERDRALGLHRNDSARMYDRCPDCGQRKAKKSERCRACSNRVKRAASERLICPVCGGHMANQRASRCGACRKARRR